MEEIKKKLLIVDDEPNIVKALKFIFESEGFEVGTAYDGESGLQAALDFMPDIIILDVMMPGMDGYTMAKKLREIEALNQCSIVFLTAKGTSGDKMMGYDSGGEYYIVKPFDNEEIVEKIKAIIW